MTAAIVRLSLHDVALLQQLSEVFAVAFDDRENYLSCRPSVEYLSRLLGSAPFIAVVARDGAEVVGGLAAYELVKFEQERSEIYLYDLAVLAAYRRRGIARALIAELQRIAAERGAEVIFVQADTTVEDEPAIALYESMSERQEVLHFDITVPHLPQVNHASD
ncbi:MAG: GNAT family N-acetyltransferase [Gemmatimonadaceae bacterium]|nr:GNAT family N-acetyltransferase [Gemmatimonadaceae bacterium]